MTTRILLADDHTLIRDLLRVYLEDAPELEIIAEADDGATAVTLARELLPDLVLMDIDMGGLSGIEATRRITRECTDTRVLLLSMHNEERYVVEGFKAGAYGYMVKSGGCREILDAIRSVLQNRLYLSPSLCGLIKKDNRRISPASLTIPTLTPREREILVLIAQGKKTVTIASLLQLSAKTVEAHRANIMKKLRLNSIAALTKYAIREGLLLLD